MKQLVVFPKGAVSRADISKMDKAGFCAIEAKDPGAIILAMPSRLVSADDLLMSAFTALAGTTATGERSAFAMELIRRAKAKESAATEAPK